MRFSRHLLTVAVLLICSACPEGDQLDSTVKIVNNSSEGIVHFIKSTVKQDTSLTTFPFSLRADNIEPRTTLPFSSDSIPGTYRNDFKERPENILMIFLFSKTTLEQVPWSQVVSQYLILERYEMTLDSLERRKWRIDYP